MRVVVTGATGFVGKAVCSHLLNNGVAVTGLTRSNHSMGKVHGVNYVNVGNIEQVGDWVTILTGFDAVVHCAAIAHDQQKNAGEVEYSEVNCHTAARIAQSANAAGVACFIHVSSAGVLGGQGEFTDTSSPEPVGFYAKAKCDSEDAVLSAVGVECRAVVLRPCLMYGEGVKGNMRLLAKLAASGMPLPFGKFSEPKSFLGVSNLASAVYFCLVNQKISQEKMLVADMRVWTLPEWLQCIRSTSGMPERIFDWPTGMLKLAAAVGGKSAAFDKMTQKLVYSASALRARGWQPEFDCEYDIERMMCSL